MLSDTNAELCDYGEELLRLANLSDGVHFEKYYGVAEIKKLLAETLQKAE